MWAVWPLLQLCNTAIVMCKSNYKKVYINECDYIPMKSYLSKCVVDQIWLGGSCWPSPVTEEEVATLSRVAELHLMLSLEE